MLLPLQAELEAAKKEAAAAAELVNLLSEGTLGGPVVTVLVNSLPTLVSGACLPVAWLS